MKKIKTNRPASLKSKMSPKPGKLRKKRTDVFDDVKKMLIEETEERKIGTEKFVEERTEPSAETKDSGQASEEESETRSVKEEKRETPVKRKRRRTELKSDVRKSFNAKDLVAEVNNFSKMLTSTINAEKSKRKKDSVEDEEAGKSDPETQDTEPEVRNNSKRRKKSPKEEKQSEGDLSEVLAIRDPELDLSNSEYFKNKKSMIVSISSDRLRDAGFIEKVHRDENLPDNWFTYITIYSNGTRRIREFITPDRRIIRSVEGLAEFMRISNMYSEEEMEKVMANYKSRRSLVKTEPSAQSSVS